MLGYVGTKEKESCKQIPREANVTPVSPLWLPALLNHRIEYAHSHHFAPKLPVWFLSNIPVSPVSLFSSVPEWSCPVTGRKVSPVWRVMFSIPRCVALEATRESEKQVSSEESHNCVYTPLFIELVLDCPYVIWTESAQYLFVCSSSSLILCEGKIKLRPCTWEFQVFRPPWHGTGMCFDERHIELMRHRISITVSA